MKTVKDVSEITGISIRTLRYYDEIGLLKPTKLTEAGYRLYDNKAVEKLQEINRLNGIIELITDVMKGVNTMSFGAFSNEEVQKMVNHTLECMSKESLDKLVEEYGSIEKCKEHLASGFANEQAIVDLLKWYGSKEKAMEAVMQSTGNAEEIVQGQDKNAKIYELFMEAKKVGNMDMAHSAVEMLAENYKTMFMLDNARNILIDLAKEYSSNEKLAEITDKQYGVGCAEYVANAIKVYYGIFHD